MVEQPDPQIDATEPPRPLYPPLMPALFVHLQRRIVDMDEVAGIAAAEFVSNALRYHWLAADLTCLACQEPWPCWEFQTRTAVGASILGLVR